MATKISVEQRFEFLSKMGANIDWDALESSDAQLGIDKPSELGAQATLFIKNGCRMQLILKRFAIWKAITVAPKSGDEFIAELTTAGIEVSIHARDIMGKLGFKVLKETRILKLAKVTVRELGFTERPTTDEIWARIQELGGELCPPEAGPEICKNHYDQENGTAFWLAMKQITDSSGDPSIFCVGRRSDGARWLDARCASPDVRWLLDNEVVFGFRE